MLAFLRTLVNLKSYVRPVSSSSIFICLRTDIRAIDGGEYKDEVFCKEVLPRSLSA